MLKCTSCGSKNLKRLNNARGTDLFKIPAYDPANDNAYTQNGFVVELYECENCGNIIITKHES